MTESDSRFLSNLRIIAATTPQQREAIRTEIIDMIDDAIKRSDEIRGSPSFERGYKAAMRDAKTFINFVLKSK